MIIVHVFVQVKPGQAEAFIAATLENARQSRLEPGITCFDLLRRQDDPDQFILVEIYRTEADTLRHKETGHYQTWRDTVADMMAVPRRGVRCEKLDPAG